MSPEGNKLYVSHFDDGVTAFDISQPTPSPAAGGFVVPGGTNGTGARVGFARLGSAYWQNGFQEVVEKWCWPSRVTKQCSPSTGGAMRAPSFPVCTGRVSSDPFTE